MQTNLHRVSEFAVTTMQKVDDGEFKGDVRSAIKRLREHDSDTDSEVDDTVSSSQGGPVLDSPGDSSKPDIIELDAVYLSLDGENEEPYEKAVER